jgi:PDZ domain-containing secreted protein
VGVVAWLPIPNHTILLPGPAVSTLDQVDVEGHPRPEDPGEYFISTVYQRPATTWWAMRALLQSDWSLVASDPERPRSQTVGYEDSEHQILRRVVYHTCGIEPPVLVSVLDLTADSPLKGLVEPGDRVTRVAGVPLRMVRQVREIVQSQPRGEKIPVEFLRPDGRAYRLETTARPIRGLSGELGLGLLLSGHEDDDNLPKIRFHSGSYEGNSSDLILGLDLCERLLSLDLRRGRRVSGSGGLDMEGSLTSVRGLRQKFSCARKARADIFFIPVEDAKQLQGMDFQASHPRIVPIHSLSEAIYWLQRAKP